MSRVYKFVLIKYIGVEEVGRDKTKVILGKQNKNIHNTYYDTTLVYQPYGRSPVLSLYTLNLPLPYFDRLQSRTTLLPFNERNYCILYNINFKAFFQFFYLT